MDKISKSEKRIFRSFLSLREKYPLEKIKVKDICEDADVSKSSFYNYFLDVYDVSDKLELLLIKDCLNNSGINDIRNVNELVGRLKPSFDLHEKELGIISQNRVEDYLFAVEKELLGRINCDNMLINNKLILTFVIGGTVHVLDRYYSLINDKDYAESIEKIEMLSKKILEEYDID